MEGSAVRASVGRWARLTAYRLTDDLRPLGWAVAGVTAANALSLIVAKTLLFRGDHMSLWGAFVVIASLLTAASAFRTMHEGRSATDWILWPASATEKLAAAVAEVVVVVPLGLTLVAVALSGLFSGLEQWVAQRTFGPWVPWEGAGLRGMLALPVVLTVMLAGAAAFRKHAVFKTSLVVAGTAAAAVLVLLGVLWIVGRVEWQWSGGEWDLEWDRGRVHQTSPAAHLAIRVLSQLWFYVLLPVSCLAFAWAKVREKEARDEVQ